MIPYALAEEYAKWVQAIFIIESREVLLQTGDYKDGDPTQYQALGPGQMHPAAFIATYGRSVRFRASVSDSWPEAWVKACASHFDLHLDQLGLDLCVMAWQEGVQAVLDGKRNEPYLNRWKTVLATL